VPSPDVATPVAPTATPPAAVAAVAPRLRPPFGDAPAAAEAPSAADDEIEARLAKLDPAASLRTSLDGVLRAWRVPGVRGDEEVARDGIESLAHDRGLEELRLTGNLSMLRLLDLPAILEIRPHGARATSYVVLMSIGDDQVAVNAGGETVQLTPAQLDRVWFGDAHIVWRDFEWLGPTFGDEAQGAHVARLQKVLARAGLYDGPANGAFDGPTKAAVVGFQRSRRLDPDGRVGRLTRIALYGAASGYALPKLAAAPSTPGGPGRGVRDRRCVVSSILEALRELEGDRPPAVRRELPPPERPPGVARRATGAMIPVLGGLAVGIVVFGIYAWGPRIAESPAPLAPAATPAASAPVADPAPAERPNWLDTADAPRAKVDRTATAAPAPAPPAPAERTATAERPADPPPARPAAEDRTDSDSGGPAPAARSPSRGSPTPKTPPRASRRSASRVVV
jgi:peptidoglycan hydrolase-like protein with peptidoglycan-binding domain